MCVCAVCACICACMRDILIYTHNSHNKYSNVCVVFYFIEMFFLARGERSCQLQNICAQSVAAKGSHTVSETLSAFSLFHAACFTPRVQAERVREASQWLVIVSTESSCLDPNFQQDLKKDCIQQFHIPRSLLIRGITVRWFRGMYIQN